MVMVTPPDDTAPVAFMVTNFTLVAPLSPSCVNTSDNCGHVHLLVDDTACTPDGSPYDNAGQASPINAVLSTCPTVNGAHTVRLELHHNDHSPIVDANMTTISTSVMITASGG